MVGSLDDRFPDKENPRYRKIFPFGEARTLPGLTYAGLLWNNIFPQISLEFAVEHNFIRINPDNRQYIDMKKLLHGELSKDEMMHHIMVGDLDCSDLWKAGHKGQRLLDKDGREQTEQIRKTLVEQIEEYVGSTQMEQAIKDNPLGIAGNPLGILETQVEQFIGNIDPLTEITAAVPTYQDWILASQRLKNARTKAARQRRIEKQIQRAKDGNSILLYKGYFPEFIVKDDRIVGADETNTYVFMARPFTQIAIDNGIDPAELLWKRGNDMRSLYFVVTQRGDEFKVFHPTICDFGMLIPANLEHVDYDSPDEKETLLGTGGFAKVFDMVNAAAQYQLQETEQGFKGEIHHIARKHFVIPPGMENHPKIKIMLDSAELEKRLYKKLRGKPFIADACEIPLSPDIAPEILYGTLNSFVHDIERKAEKEFSLLPGKEFHPKRNYTGFDIGIYTAMHHMIGAFISKETWANGDIKPDNWMISDDKQPEFADDEDIIWSQVHPAAKKLYMPPHFHRGPSLKLIDWGIARDTDVPIYNYKQSAACTLEFIDEAWFCNGAYPSLETDIYAASLSLMELVKDRASKALEDEKVRLEEERERQIEKFDKAAGDLEQRLELRDFMSTVVSTGKGHRWKYQELASSYSKTEEAQILDYLKEKTKLETDAHDPMKMLGLQERRNSLDEKKQALKERFDYALEVIVTADKDLDFEEFLETITERDDGLAWLYEDVFMLYTDEDFGSLRKFESDSQRYRRFGDRWEELRRIEEDTISDREFSKVPGEPVHTLYQAWNMLVSHTPLLTWLDMTPPGKKNYSQPGKPIVLYQDCTKDIAAKLERIKAMPEQNALSELFIMTNINYDIADYTKEVMKESLEKPAEEAEKIWAENLTGGYSFYDPSRLGKAFYNIAMYVTRRSDRTAENVAQEAQSYLNSMMDTYIAPPLEIINNYHDQTFKTLVELIDSGILKMRRRVPGLVYSGLRRPSVRFSLDPDTPNSSLTPLKFLRKFRDFYQNPERYGQGPKRENNEE